MSSSSEKVHKGDELLEWLFLIMAAVFLIYFSIICIIFYQTSRARFLSSSWYTALFWITILMILLVLGLGFYIIVHLATHRKDRKQPISQQQNDIEVEEFKSTDVDKPVYSDSKQRKVQFSQTRKTPSSINVPQKEAEAEDEILSQEDLYS